MNEATFQRYSYYYDLLYQDKPYEAEVAFVLEKLSRFIKKDKYNILELGSGSGKHAAYFAAKGHSVVGVERSESMVGEANKRDLPLFRSIQADIRYFSIPEKFDVSVALFHVISYLTDTDSLVACFQRVYEHLAPGGVFLFDVWYTPAVHLQKPQTRIKRLITDEVKLLRITEPHMDINRSTVEVNFELIVEFCNSNSVDRIRETHVMRHFSFGEIELLARLTGFDIVDSCEFLTGHSLDESTWGGCFALKKSII